MVNYREVLSLKKLGYTQRQLLKTLEPQKDSYIDEELKDGFSEKGTV